MKKSLAQQVPKLSDYRDARDAVVAHLRKRVSGRVFCVYGSARRPDATDLPGRIDCGTSDIDVFVLERRGFVPPFERLQEFGEVLADIHPGVTIQTNWQTKKTLGGVMGTGPGYLAEVKRGTKGFAASKGFLEAVQRPFPEAVYEFEQEDTAMLRHFYRKIVSSTMRIPGTRRHLEYHEVVGLYEAYKKFFSVLSGIVRLLDGKLLFGQPKREVVRAANRVLGADLDEGLLSNFAESLGDLKQVLVRFENSRLSVVQAEFQRLYAEFEKAVTAMLSMEVGLKTREVLVITK